MNPLVSFRANGLGQNIPTRAQRLQAAQEITANLRVRLLALQNKGVAAQAVGLSKSGAAKAVSAGASKATDGERTTTGDTLDQDAFLQLLVQQLQHQDPTDPMDNTDMLAQLAQFAALEQSTALNENFTNLGDRMEYLVGNIDQLNYISAQGLIGQSVAGVNAAGEEVEGVVQSVGLVGSIVTLNIADQVLPMSGVLRIGDAPATKSKGGG